MIEMRNISKIASNTFKRILTNKKPNVNFWVSTKEAQNAWHIWARDSSGFIRTSRFITDGDGTYVKSVIDKVAAENPDCVIDAVIQARKA